MLQMAGHGSLEQSNLLVGPQRMSPPKLGAQFSLLIVKQKTKKPKTLTVCFEYFRALPVEAYLGCSLAMRDEKRLKITSLTLGRAATLHYSILPRTSKDTTGKKQTVTGCRQVRGLALPRKIAQ